MNVLLHLVSMASAIMMSMSTRVLVMMDIQDLDVRQASACESTLQMMPTLKCTELQTLLYMVIIYLFDLLKQTQCSLK